MSFNATTNDDSAATAVSDTGRYYDVDGSMTLEEPEGGAAPLFISLSTSEDVETTRNSVKMTFIIFFVSSTSAVL